jgi:pSer/pThr/pTyr-binding forkhead associated (FHA) protein
MITNGLYCVLIIDEKIYRKTLILENANYSIGRDHRNKICLQSKKISRFHANLVRKISPDHRSFSYWLLDGNLKGNRSTNGIFINNQRCLVQELEHGDNINLGLEVQMNYYIMDSISDVYKLRSEDFDLTTKVSLEIKTTKENTEYENTEIIRPRDN